MKQDRLYLLLKEDEPSKIAKKILKSPLELAIELISKLNENRFEELKDNLDTIKQFVGGIKRAEILKNDYKLANYYTTMFAFHQYFNSSFRARQGKALEAVMKEIIKNYTECNVVPDKTLEMQKIIKKTYHFKEKPSLDIDSLGKDDKNKRIIIVQLRSRDDTGGTTAKGSLADFLRYLLRTHKKPSYEITYLIAVWDKRKSQQKNSTITKIYSSLKEYIKIKEEDFKKRISLGLEISKNLNIKLAYGTDEISTSLYEWNRKKSKNILSSIKKVTKTITNWDDLWISYAISSLEIEIKSFYGYSNIEILDKHLKKLNIELNESFNIKDLDDTALKISSIWKQDSIPLPSVSDRILYIRDLIFIKLIYNRIQLCSNKNYLK